MAATLQHRRRVHWEGKSQGLEAGRPRWVRVGGVCARVGGGVGGCALRAICVVGEADPANPVPVEYGFMLPKVVSALLVYVRY